MCDTPARRNFLNPGHRKLIPRMTTGDKCRLSIHSILRFPFKGGFSVFFFEAGGAAFEEEDFGRILNFLVEVG
jgi:hypothetical protein